jgi:preprotein translocase subunit SecY
MAEEEGPPEFKDRVREFLKKLPSVQKAEGHVHFRRKVGWTLAMLFLYFVMTNIPVFGLSPNSVDLFHQFRAFFAGEQGSLTTLGISPIVTAGILLQLMVGAQIIKLDLTDKRDKAIFQGLQKLFVFILIPLETFPQIAGGFLQPDEVLALRLGVNPGTLSLLIFLQICLGSVLILFMDEIVSKWGIGSGVSMFILAGVSLQIFNGLFNWWNTLQPFQAGPATLQPPVGLVPRWLWMATDPNAAFVARTDPYFILGRNGAELLALLATVAIFLIVVYFESVRLEIPLAHASVRGARGRFPVKLLYVSNIPIILIGTLQANIAVFGVLLASKAPFLGTYDTVVNPASPTPLSGPLFYLSTIAGPEDWWPGLAGPYLDNLRLANGLTPIADWQILLRLVVYTVVILGGSVLFAWFWVNTASMGPSDVAKQIEKSGMQIPGFRRTRDSMEKVMQRYIPKVTVLGGLIIGLLVLFGSMLGTIGQVSPTGLLLGVSITYNLYQAVAREQVMEMHPLIRRAIGEG